MQLQFWQIRAALAQPENSKVGSDPVPVAFIVSDLEGREDGQTIQVQQDLPGMAGNFSAVAVLAGHAHFARPGTESRVVAVAVPAGPACSARYGW